MDEAMKLAEKICKNAQKAIRASKLAIRRGMDCDISTAVSYEALPSPPASAPRTRRKVCRLSWRRERKSTSRTLNLF